MKKLTVASGCPKAALLNIPPPEIAATLSVLGGKWKMLTLWRLLRGGCRFNELRRAIGGVSQHMLTTTLRELEAEGVVTRTVFPEIPPRVEYALTEHGKTLAQVMKVLGAWGNKHIEQRANGGGMHAND